nr:hypothetical protein [Tanacetum cinerariifolium]GFB55776.1 hypothetical protein [Tanacetum cinerariifolium]
LAYLAKTTPTHSTTSPVTVPTPKSSGDSHNDAMLSTMNQIANLLSALLMQAKEKGVVLDAEAEAFLADVECTAPYDQPLALTTTNLFEANHKDAYDSDVDEGPHASTAFMANISSTGGTNSSSSSHINEALECNKVKHDLDMAIVERNKRNAELEEENVMLKSTLKSKVVSTKNLQQESKQVLSEKKTLEDKYLVEIVVLTNANKAYSNPRYGKQARITQPALYDGHVLLNPNHPPIRVHDSEESLVHAEVCKIKMAERPGHALPINYAKLNALYDQFVPQKELS